jgi:cyclase
MTVKVKISLGLLVLLAMLSVQVSAQDFSKATITTVSVADGIYMLMGQGGNIGVSVGADGVLLIDDQFAPMHDKIVTAIENITDQPVKMLLNTHWHGDHTGGNELFADGGTLIVAHDNVRTRMSAKHFSSFFGAEQPPSPPAALPVVTFDSTVTLHINNMTIHAQYVPPAHTDGDTVIWFREANVVHLGDTFFNGFYPFIDIDSGGSLRGMIAAVDQALPGIDQATKIIPGHGPLTGRKGLVLYRDMLNTVADRIEALVADGKTRQQVIDAKPTAEYDARWGNGFLKPERWVGMLYDLVAAEQ